MQHSDVCHDLNWTAVNSTDTRPLPLTLSVRHLKQPLKGARGNATRSEVSRYGDTTRNCPLLLGKQEQS